jgi:GT2 family glycosyltransferase/lipopolysaccharide/colanic/teichoic acid biosynthesis glycosyltransferase
MTNNIKISVVIVNYNVKEYLEQSLLSIKRALDGISHEIIVVDNASVDGSVAFILQRFPNIRLIELNENLGFGKGNNIALQQVSGEFVVLINPDTIVQEDTFIKLVQFFEANPQAAGATCKIINPDGSFSIDCRHSIPTPMMAFWKVTGLSKLFPNSKIFSKYNLTYLDENEIYPIPAISGSFMMFRKEVLDKVGYFDERFFMYCEDIDLCHRVNEAGYKIYYVPTTQIIHYKGESTKKDNLDYIVTFNKSLYQFFLKYYAKSHIFLFRWIIILGIIFRGTTIYTKNFFSNHFSLIVDAGILNLVIFLSFVIRMQFRGGFYWVNFFNQYWVINLISTLIFLSLAFYIDVYPRHRFSVQAIIKTNILTFTLVATLTFFLKQFAFSRLVVIVAAFFSPFCMLSWRILLKRYYKGDRKAWGKDLFSKRTIVVGNSQSAFMLYEKILDLKDLSYDLLGIVISDQEKNLKLSGSTPILGQLEKLDELLKIYRIRQVIFTTENLSYEKILKTMTTLDHPDVEFKIVPSNLEVMIGKSVIERLDDYPLLDIEYGIGKPFNRFTKRAFDLLLSGIILLVSSPFVLPVLFINRKKLKTFDIIGDRGGIEKILQIHAWNFKNYLNRYLLFLEVLRGKISLVGAPITKCPLNYKQDNFLYKPGLTGLVQINKSKIRIPEDLEKYHLFYLKNQSMLLDIEVLLKALFQRVLFQS